MCTTICAVGIITGRFTHTHPITNYIYRISAPLPFISCICGWSSIGILCTWKWLQRGRSQLRRGRSQLRRGRNPLQRGRRRELPHSHTITVHVYMSTTYHFRGRERWMICTCKLINKVVVSRGSVAINILNIACCNYSHWKPTHLVLWSQDRYAHWRQCFVNAYDLENKVIIMLSPS